jgi:hypothetical protein
MCHIGNSIVNSYGYIDLSGDPICSSKICKSPSVFVRSFSRYFFQATQSIIDPRNHETDLDRFVRMRSMPPLLTVPQRTPPFVVVPWLSRSAPPALLRAEGMFALSFDSCKRTSWGNSPDLKTEKSILQGMPVSGPLQRRGLLLVVFDS